MRNKISTLFGFSLLLFALVACSGSKTIKKNASAVNANASVADSISASVNVDLAHESFLKALMLSQKEEHEMALEFLAQASEADPKNRYLTFQMAQKIAETGHYKLALSIAENAKKLPGQEMKSELSFLASMYMQNMMADSAKVYFKKALDKDERDFLVLYEYSLLLEAIQKNDELIRVYDVLLPQVNYGKSILNKQIKLLSAAGKDSALIDLLEQAYAVHQEVPYLQTRADLLIKNARYDEALEISDRLLSASKKDSAGVLIRARVLLLRGELKPALQFLKNAYFNLKIPSAIMLKYIALIELDLKQLDSARVHFKMLSENRIFAPSAHAELSSLARSLGDTATAILEIEKAAALDSETYVSSKAFVYYLYGRYQESYNIYDSLLGYWSHWKPTPEMQKNAKTSAAIAQMKINANKKHLAVQMMYANALIHQAHSLENKKDSLSIYTVKEARKQAAVFMQNILKAEPDNMIVLFSLAANFERIGMTEKSIEYFEIILKKEPENHQALNYLGYMLVDLNRKVAEVQRGAKLIDFALTYAPKELAYLDSKAWALYRLGKYKEALHIMESVVALSSNEIGDLVYWEHYAAIVEKLGLKQKMISAYRKILLIDPSHPESLKIIKSLE